jgi:hypothetical protein
MNPSDVPTVDEVLSLDTEALGPLRQPVLVVSLEGWFDMAGAATAAVEALFEPDRRLTIGEIDCDPFYDFTVERPMIETVDGTLRTIRWPRNQVDVWRAPDESGRDVVILLGVEPHLGWRTYCDAIRTVAERTGCSVVATVGAGAEQVPHTRSPFVTGSSTNRSLARRLGLGAPSYQGMTGTVGVLHTVLEAAGIASVSLRVGIPHYLSNASHPLAVAALQRHLSHVLGVGPGADLDDEITRHRSLHDEVVAADAQLAMYVTMLEREFDRRAEAAIPSAEDLGAELEAFLAELDDGGSEDEGPTSTS